MAQFESKQAAWEYYLNLDSRHFEEKQHNNIYTDAFVAGAEWEHKYLIEKVEKYLREYIILYVWATDLGKREVWFDDFRKTMKE